MPDHNTPTHDQDKPIKDPVSRKQVETLEANAKDFGLAYYGMMDKKLFVAFSKNNLDILYCVCYNMNMKIIFKLRSYRGMPVSLLFL